MEQGILVQERFSVTSAGTAATGFLSFREGRDLNPHASKDITRKTQFFFSPKPSSASRLELPINLNCWMQNKHYHIEVKAEIFRQCKLYQFSSHGFEALFAINSKFA
jgi:hypothetical protein